jgi:glycosyltransferase involved in cell wall biosynthesis
MSLERSLLMISSHPPGSGSGSGMRGRVTLEGLRATAGRVDVVSLASPGEEVFADPATLIVPRAPEPGILERVDALRYGGAYYQTERAADVEGRLRAWIAAGALLRAYDLVWICQSLLVRPAKRALTARAWVLDIDNIAAADRRRSAADKGAGLPLRTFRLATSVLLAREERARADRVDTVVVTSDRERELLGRVDTPVRVVPNTVAAGPRVVPSRSRPLLLFVGSLDYGSNIDAVRWLVSEILPAVRRLRPETRLRIVGRNPTDEVRGLVGDGVELVADAPSLDEHYAEARAVVAPIRLGGGTRYKILEALARGSAVISTPTGAEGIELVAGRDVLVAETPDELAAACAALIEDPARADSLGAAGHAAWAARYRPEAAERAVSALVDELLSR